MGGVGECGYIMELRFKIAVCVVASGITCNSAQCKVLLEHCH